MRTVVAAAAFSLTLSACANVQDSQISYLGLAPANAEDRDENPAVDPPTALKHIDSNRVLGAMAFEKVTRAKVSPERLVKSGY